MVFDHRFQSRPDLSARWFGHCGIRRHGRVRRAAGSSPTFRAWSVHNGNAQILAFVPRLHVALVQGTFRRQMKSVIVIRSPPSLAEECLHAWLPSIHAADPALHGPFVDRRNVARHGSVVFDLYSFGIHCIIDAGRVHHAAQMLGQHLTRMARARTTLQRYASKVRHERRSNGTGLQLRRLRCGALRCPNAEQAFDQTQRCTNSSSKAITAILSSCSGNASQIISFIAIPISPRTRSFSARFSLASNGEGLFWSMVRRCQPSVVAVMF